MSNLTPEPTTKRGVTSENRTSQIVLVKHSSLGLYRLSLRHIEAELVGTMKGLGSHYLPTSGILEVFNVQYTCTSLLGLHPAPLTPCTERHCL